MKKTSFLKFIFIFSILLGFYFIFISKINYFIKIPEKNVTTHLNTYDTKYKSDNVLSSVLEGKEMKVATLEEISVILNSDYMLNIFETLFNIKKNNTKEMIETLTKNKMISTVRSDYHDGKIFYINVEEVDIADINAFLDDNSYKGTILFTDDFNHIFFQSYLSNENAEYISRDSITMSKENQDVDAIKKNIEKYLEKMNITNRYDFKITSFQNNDFGSIYYLEDSFNNIKIDYSWYYNQIFGLQIGFTKD